jgi:2-polyprenyl-3-methyl-5-hydroxy-6-metoxy-1,4-benzoquinol methylase
MHHHKWISINGRLRDFPEVGVVKCDVCGLVQPEKDLRSHVSYESGTMHLWAKGWGEKPGKPSGDQPRRLREVASVLPKNGYFLDVGCGDGNFVRAVENLTPNAFGIDPDSKHASSAMQDGIKIFTNLADLKGMKFQVISLFHTVEHFYDLPSELEEIRKLLAPDGKLMIETPNANDALLTRYQSEPFSNFTFWSHHPNLCTNTFLSEALEDAGFQVERNTQVQRYGLANHLYWLSKGLPGGHDIWSTASNPDLNYVYGEHLISEGVADTIWIMAGHAN